MAKTKSKSEPCPACGGSGTVVWATDALKCAACNGSGKVDVPKSSAKDRG